jgi:predicted RNA binding protein YcfA (HicA-like mRNA interferase family)
MKYSELEELLRKFGCYDTGKDCHGHPLWYSPKAKKEFMMSRHRRKEVALGTLNKILKDAGIKG